jgi:sarcosine oxidase gamma subunit
VSRTPLYDAHRALGARMVDFAGWDMPVQYQGIIDEHTAVRTRAGLFDVSHMGEIELRGAGALDACQRATANDVRRLRDGGAQYSLLLHPEGGIVDDIIVHRLTAERVMICVNASNRAADFAYLRDHATGADVVDVSDATALLALQGPRATAILARCTALPLADIPRFAFAEGAVAGRTALVAHTGYTGEDGWEPTPPPPTRGRCGRAAGRRRGDASVPPARRARHAAPRRAAALRSRAGADTPPYEARPAGWATGEASLVAPRSLPPRRGPAVNWSASSRRSPAFRAPSIACCVTARGGHRPAAPNPDPGKGVARICRPRRKRGRYGAGGGDSRPGRGGTRGIAAVLPARRVVSRRGPGPHRSGEGRKRTWSFPTI